MAGLGAASRMALACAEVVLGARRHLDLLPELEQSGCERRVWPVPFADGIAPLLALRGRKVVVLASGDPFWFGAGTVLARHLQPAEWVTLPAPSVFSLAAARLGWALENTPCLGLHAAPLSRLRPHLHARQRLLVLVRDGAAVSELAAWLTALGFGASQMHVLEALGGPRERARSVPAAEYRFDDVKHPVAIGLEVACEDAAANQILPCASGLPDNLFEHDGQLTKRPLRALTLSTLAPKPGERLWDIGTGSGSIAIEWLLAHPGTQAIAFEADPERAARARRNAQTLGVDRLQLVQGKAPDVLADQPLPDAVFIGGGLSDALLVHLWQQLPTGTRLVANAVTLESETLLAQWQADKGGELLRIELADASPLGDRRGWKSRYPVVQWSVIL